MEVLYQGASASGYTHDMTLQLQHGHGGLGSLTDYRVAALLFDGHHHHLRLPPGVLLGACIGQVGLLGRGTSLHLSLTVRTTTAATVRPTEGNTLLALVISTG